LGVVCDAYLFALGVEMIAALKVAGRARLIAKGLTLGVIHCGRHVCDRPRGFPFFLCLRIEVLLVGAASKSQDRWNEQKTEDRTLLPGVAESEHSTGHFASRVQSHQRCARGHPEYLCQH
jgi:hypothetical protein